MKMKIAFALIMFCYCVIIAKADDPTVNVEKDFIYYDIIAIKWGRIDSLSGAKRPRANRPGANR